MSSCTVRVSPVTRTIGSTTYGELKPLDLLLQAGSLELRSERVEIGSPPRSVLADDRAALRTLSQAGGFTKVHFLPETCARIAADVSG